MGKRGIYKSSYYLLVSAIAFLLSVTASYAKTVTYVKEYTYQASELDSKLSSRTIALEQVKRLLLEELGTYLISEAVVKDFELTKDQISSLTAGILMTVILEEKWDGKTYFLKAKITTETDELIKSINNVRRDQEQSKNWEEMRERTEKALREIERLKKETGNVKEEKARQEEFAKVVNELYAMDWFKKGYVLRYNAKKNQEAMKAFDKAIEIDPNYAKAYAGKAAIYNEWRQYEEALRESERAIRLDPRLALGFNCRGKAHMGMSNYQKAIEDFNKARELDPEYAWPYVNLSHVYRILNNYHQALENANKAIEIDPELANAYFQRGRALASLNNVQDAVKSFDQAIELDPMFSLPFVGRGYALMKLGKTEEALEDFKRAAILGNNKAQNYLMKKGMQW